MDPYSAYLRVYAIVRSGTQLELGNMKADLSEQALAACCFAVEDAKAPRGPQTKKQLMIRVESVVSGA